MQQFKILLAEDDVDDFATLRDAFNETGNNSMIQRCEDGEKLIASLDTNIRQNKTPDLIILDINMPRMNGIDTLEKLKHNEATENIPVFMYSTSNNIDQMHKCYNLGAERFVTKGNHFDTVLRFARYVVKFISERKCIYYPDNRVNKFNPNFVK